MGTTLETSCEIWGDSRQFEEHAEELDELLEEVGAPVTAEVSWLRTWLASFPEVEPWLVAVRDHRGRLQAVAPLARRRRGSRNDLTLIGDGVSDYGWLPARNEAAAAALADALVARLVRRGARWSLALRQIPADDPVAVRLAARLQHARLLPGQPAPRTIITERDITAYTSRNYRKSARNRRSRLARQGHGPRVDFLRDPDEVHHCLDEVVETCRERERQMLGRSPLDDRRRERFFRKVVCTFAHQGRLELAVLRANDELAAYAVSLLDGDAYRMWNAHHAVTWSDFSPGQVLDYEIVQRIVDDPSLAVIDWMMGMESYKLRVANRTEPTEELLAWSHPGVGARAFGPQRLRGRLELAAEEDECAGRVLEGMRVARQRLLRTGR